MVYTELTCFLIEERRKELRQQGTYWAGTDKHTSPMGSALETDLNGDSDTAGGEPGAGGKKQTSSSHRTPK